MYSSLIQFVRYGIAGGVATIIHVVLFHVFAWKIFPALQETDAVVVLLGLKVISIDNIARSFNSMLSNSSAFLGSNLVGYIINIYWVFEPGRHKKIIEFSLFFIVSATSMVVGTVLMGFLIRTFGIQTTVAFVANIVSAVMINFLVRKYYIFRG